MSCSNLDISLLRCCYIFKQITIIRMKLYQRYIFLCLFLAIFIWTILNFVTLIFYGDTKSRASNDYDGESHEDSVGGSDNDQDVNELGIVRDEEDLRLREDGYAKHAFNLLISKRLSLHRRIKDTRHELCQSKTYSADLPYASIIICFYNEAWTVLLRTLHSVLDRTPQHLHEIILVDDYSDIPYLKQELDNYTSKYPKIRIIRTQRREGLIRGRMIGAKAALGQILVFLDSHCEVNVNWLPPLLEHIKLDPHNVVCPVIDIINADTFEYKASPVVRGAFNWGLHFSWEPLSPELLRSPEDYVKPIRSPTMAGGLFAIDKQYFHYLGDYDPGMEIWGAENLEISFRIWMCGGKLEIIQCSRVGHIFRRRRPYGSDSKGDTMSQNSMRLAEVWLDEYKKYFYDIHNDLIGKPFGNITSRLNLRKRLNCKSFKWYLEHIYPEMVLPNERPGKLVPLPPRRNPATVWKGKLQSVGRHGYCLDSPGHSSEKRAQVVLHECDETNSKYWSLNEDRELKLDGLLCLEASNVQAKKSIRIMKCRGQGGDQEWKYMKNKDLLYHTSTGLCLTIGDKLKIEMGICEKYKKKQKWKFVY